MCIECTLACVEWQNIESLLEPLESESMNLIKRSELPFVRAVSQLNYANPFLQQRLDLERAALGQDFVTELHPFWSFAANETKSRRANVLRIAQRVAPIAKTIRAKLLAGEPATDEELEWYDDLALYILFYELFDDWGQLSPPSFKDITVCQEEVWKRFAKAFEYWLGLPGLQLPSSAQVLHLFALFNQIYRAFYNIFECVIGQSLPAANLRAQIWQSIFTHDLRRYRRSLYRTMHHVTTLVIGPSGSGKELVAQAIGMSRYIPFDPKSRRFATQPAESYFAINISAFSTSVIESELFGHAKGAFTDASSTRAGWLDACGEHGSLLLDEIGELEPTTQVKLLRVLQNRQYQRLGETKIREFQGKIIAATNRNLGFEIEQRTFREDLYYRLCADVIETPTLFSQLQDNPAVLANIVAYIAKRIAPDEQTTLTSEVVEWLQRHMPSGYQWPGNIRELEQCVRNIMIRDHYAPSPSAAIASGEAKNSRVDSESLELAKDIHSISLTADELLQRYCRIAYRQTKSFEKAAKLLQLDRRTVRAKVDTV